MALKITDLTIDEVLKGNELVVVDFWANWCGPCRMIGPIVDEISLENPDIIVGKVDVNDNPTLTSKYGVTSIPCIVFIKNGVEVERTRGVLSKSALQAKINEYKQ